MMDDEIRQSMGPSKLLTTKIKVFGEEFEVSTDVNQWLMLKMIGGDAGALAKVVEGMLQFRQLQPGLTDKQLAQARMDDYAAQQHWDETMAKQRGLKIESIIGLVNKIVEHVAERPTKSSSGSSRTSATEDD